MVPHDRRLERSHHDESGVSGQKKPHMHTHTHVAEVYFCILPTDQTTYRFHLRGALLRFYVFIDGFQTLRSLVAMIYLLRSWVFRWRRRTNN